MQPSHPAGTLAHLNVQYGNECFALVANPHMYFLCVNTNLFSKEKDLQLIISVKTNTRLYSLFFLYTFVKKTFEFC